MDRPGQPSPITTPAFPTFMTIIPHNCALSQSYMAILVPKTHITQFIKEIGTYDCLTHGRLGTLITFASRFS